MISETITSCACGVTLISFDFIIYFPVTALYVINTIIMSVCLLVVIVHLSNTSIPRMGGFVCTMHFVGKKYQATPVEGPNDRFSDLAGYDQSRRCKQVRFGFVDSM